MKFVKKIVYFVFNPLVMALLITIYLYRQYQLNKFDQMDQLKYVIMIYASLIIFLWFFNKSSMLETWKVPSVPFNIDGAFSGA